MRRMALGLLLSLSLALPCAHGEAKTVILVPFVSGLWPVPNITRGYTTQRDSIHRNLFYSVGGAGSFLYEDNRGSLNVLVFNDPGWNRILFAVEGEVIQALGTTGSGQDQFTIPSGLDVAPIGNVFIADTGNNRVQAYAFEGRAFTPQGGLIHDDRLVFQFSIQGGTNFAQPTQVCWEDGGTPSVSTDDYLWVLDRWGSKIAGYHVTYNGSQYVASPYIYLDLHGCGLCPHPVDPKTITKGRSYTTADEFGSYNTSDLYVYDAANDQFLIYTIQRDPGFITTAMQSSMVTVRAAPNPYLGSQYRYMTADAWGNICAIDPNLSRICKLGPDLVGLDTYGQAGSGPLGSEDMLDPGSLSFQKIKRPNAPNQFTSRAILTERWSDQTGIQQVKMGITARSASALMRSVVDSVDVSYFTTDLGKVTLQILNSSGNPVRTIFSNQIQGPGVHAAVWNGRNDAGTALSKCSTYSLRVQAVGFYASPETSTVTAPFYYKPRSLRTIAVNSNVPGTLLTFDGRDSVLTGNTFAAACSLCTSHIVSVPPTQMLAGSHYCFQSWTGGADRVRSVNVQGDTTLQLTLTTGSPPDTFVAGATLPLELFDCNSPYVFLGDAKTSTAGLTLYPNTTLRFKILGSPAQFRINGPLSANGVHFETTDSTANNSTGKWSGLVADTLGSGVVGGGNISIALRNCTIRNAVDAISTVNWWNTNFTPRLMRSLTVDSVTFTSNATDIRVKFLPTAESVLRLNAGWFYARSPVKVWGAWGGEPNVACTITNSQFLGLPLASMVGLTGGMSGQINGNQFRGAESGTTTLDLAAYSNTSGPIPNVSLTGNKFNCTVTTNRLALRAPYAPTGTNILAYNNDWGVYDLASIDQLIFDKANEQGDPNHNPPIPGRAEVFYNPFTAPSGGGGGGGCPFVLSRSDTGFVVENTLLGVSELGPTSTSFVDDAYPLTYAVRDGQGRVTLRIAELESETDKLDYVGLVADTSAAGIEYGISLSGAPFAYQSAQDQLNVTRWSGRNSPYVSPIAPGSAYSGEGGDSLELGTSGYTPPRTGWGRGIGIHLIPKPHSGQLPVIPMGVTIRISPDLEGDRWITLPPLLPREHWSTTIIPIDALTTSPVKRVRIVWNTNHVLGHVALVDTRRLAELRPLPLLSAHHSTGRTLSAQIGERDGSYATLRPGEYAQLVFDASATPAKAQFILLARGGYVLGTNAEVPAAYGVSRNRPNPFNPETSFDLALPKTSRVSVRIYDVAGKLVRSLVDETMAAGTHVIRWDGTDQRKRPLASGVYYYQLNAGEFSRRDRVVLLR